MITFGTYRMNVLFARRDYETQIGQAIRPFNYSDPEMIYLADYGFDFAVKLNRPLPAKYGRIEATHTRFEKVLNEELGIEIRDSIRQEIELDLCGEDLFNHTDQEEIERKGIAEYYCPKNKSMMHIGGSFLSDKYEYITIRLLPCINSTSNVTCAPKEESQEYFTRKFIQFRTRNFYFDHDTLGNPIKSYIDDRIYFGITEAQMIENNIKMKVSQAKYDDSLIPWAPKRVQDFLEVTLLLIFQIGDIFSVQVDRRENDPYCQINVKFDVFYNVYQKQLYSATMYLSELGGLFNAVYGVGKLFTVLLMESLIMSKVIKKLFRYDSEEIYSSKPSTLNVSTISHLNLEQKEEVRKALQESISSQQFLNYNYGSKFYQWLRSKCMHIPRHESRTLKLYDQARSRIIHEFDIINLFRMFQEFKVLKKLIMSKKQRFLFSHQKAFLLSKQVTDKNGHDFQKSTSSLDLLQSMRTHSRASILKKVDEELDSIIFSSRKKKIDKKLIKGVIAQLSEEEPPETSKRSNKRKNEERENINYFQGTQNINVYEEMISSLREVSSMNSDPQLLQPKVKKQKGKRSRTSKFPTNK